MAACEQFFDWRKTRHSLVIAYSADFAPIQPLPRRIDQFVVTFTGGDCFFAITLFEVKLGDRVVGRGIGGVLGDDLLEKFDGAGGSGIFVEGEGSGPERGVGLESTFEMALITGGEGEEIPAERRIRVPDGVGPYARFDGLPAVVLREKSFETGVKCFFLRSDVDCGEEGVNSRFVAALGIKG